MQDVAVLTTLADSWQEAQPMDEPVGFAASHPARMIGPSTSSAAGVTILSVDESGITTPAAIAGASSPTCRLADGAKRLPATRESCTLLADLIPSVSMSTILPAIPGHNYKLLHASSLRMTMGAWDGKLYVAGGDAWTGVFEPTNQVDVYDIASNTWGSGPVMPPPLRVWCGSSWTIPVYIGGYSGAGTATSTPHGA
jgi:hypothetical protein